MSSPIEVSDRAKSRLETLRDEVRKATGREMSQREIIEYVVERGYASKADLVSSLRDGRELRSEGETPVFATDDWEPPTDEELAAFFSGTSDWGFETSQEEIDDVLYGK